MIHIFVGTKAQFIKMAAVMKELERQNIPYNFIDAGQHAGLSDQLIKQFRLRPPDVRLRSANTSITTIPHAMKWAGSSLFRAAFQPDYIFDKVFRNQCGICLIHGDTLTTLISLFYAKRCNLKVAHIEAGLRSFHLLDPFPEESIRLISMRFSDLLFAPSDWAAENLTKMGYSSKSVNLQGNTIVDTIRFALNQAKGAIPVSQPYVLATSHRVETIYSKKRLAFIMEVLEDLSQKYTVLFVLHAPTCKQLERFGFIERLNSNPNITLLPLQPYLEFVNLLSQAEFIVTDGGSIQEEANFLGVPCLIMRDKTERIEGLSQTAHLSHFDRRIVDEFVRELPNLKGERDSGSTSPSKLLVEHILAWV